MLTCLYRARNLVERFFNKIKQCRRIATRYDKLAANYLAFVKLAAIRIWLRAYESTPLIDCPPHRDGGRAALALAGGGVGVAGASAAGGVSLHLFRCQASSASLVCPRTAMYSFR
jgi:hypothetical protein